MWIEKSAIENRLTFCPCNNILKLGNCDTQTEGGTAQLYHTYSPIMDSTRKTCIH